MNVFQKLPNFEFFLSHRSGMKTENFEMIFICSIILFITWSFSFLNHISKVPGHYINSKMQYSTARTAVILSYVSMTVNLIIDQLHTDDGMDTVNTLGRLQAATKLSDRITPSNR